jgi:hypothetical protein
MWRTLGVRASTIATSTFKILTLHRALFSCMTHHLGTSLPDYLLNTTADNTSLIQTYLQFQIDTRGSYVEKPANTQTFNKLASSLVTAQTF